MEDVKNTQHRRQGLHHRGRGTAVRPGLGERLRYDADAGTARRAVLGGIVASDGEWLWRLAGEDMEPIRNRPKAQSPNISAMNRTASRPSEAYCRPSRDRYSATAADDPWASMPDAHSTTMPDAVSQTSTGTGRGSLGFGLPDANAPAGPGSRHRPRRHASHRTRDRNVKGDGHHA